MRHAARLIGLAFAWGFVTALAVVHLGEGYDATAQMVGSLVLGAATIVGLRVSTQTREVKRCDDC